MRVIEKCPRLSYLRLCLPLGEIVIDTVCPINITTLNLHYTYQHLQDQYDGTPKPHYIQEALLTRLLTLPTLQNLEIEGAKTMDAKAF